MSSLVDTYLWVLFLSVIIGLGHFYFKKNNTYLNTLSFFLLYIFIIEKIGEYLSNNYKPNAWLYNYSSVTEISYYLWLIGKMFNNRRIYKSFVIIILLNGILSLLNIIFIQGKSGFHSITFGIGSLLLIAACGYYFYRLLQYPKEVSLVKQMEFWICTAILFSFGCGFPIFCMNNFYANKISEAIWPIISALNKIINIVFYTLFIVAFLCKMDFRKRTHKLQV